jgi:hypothetical protein
MPWKSTRNPAHMTSALAGIVSPKNTQATFHHPETLRNAFAGCQLIMVLRYPGTPKLCCELGTIPAGPSPEFNNEQECCLRITSIALLPIRISQARHGDASGAARDSRMRGVKVLLQRCSSRTPRPNSDVNLSFTLLGGTSKSS